MKAFELRAYDALPGLLQDIVGMAARMNGIPYGLEGALAACDRVAEAGCYTTKAGIQPVTPGAVARQKALIRLAMAFRDGVASTLIEVAG